MPIFFNTKIRCNWKKMSTQLAGTFVPFLWTNIHTYLGDVSICFFHFNFHILCLIIVYRWVTNFCYLKLNNSCIILSNHTLPKNKTNLLTSFLKLIFKLVEKESMISQFEKKYINFITEVCSCTFCTYNFRHVYRKSILLNPKIQS